MKNFFDLFRKADNLPGGNKDPFEERVGQTDTCLSSRQVNAYIDNGENAEVVNGHIGNCDFCRGRVEAIRKIKAKR